MIITITMNPAVDKTITLDQLELGGLSRVKSIKQDAGGKGINVSKTIKALHGESLALGFVGGESGTFIVRALNELDIKHDFVYLDQNTRVNTKVVENSGRVSEINEPGPIINREMVDLLLEKVRKYAAEDVVFVLAGSIPLGVDKGIYGKIVDIAHLNGAEVILDADGDLFRESLPSNPDYIKPNREELEKYAGLDHEASKEELIAIGQGLKDKGIANVLISLGKEGALFLMERNAFVPGLKVVAQSTVGAGDALVGALAYSVEHKLELEDLIELAIATSAGAVTTHGTQPPTNELVNELKKQVKIELL